MSVLAHPEQLSLNKHELDLIPAFRAFLKRHPTPIGKALLDEEKKPWRAPDAKYFEDLVARYGGEEKRVASFLAIAHNAAHHWSVENGKRVRLPRFHVIQRPIPLPTSTSFAVQAARYRSWRSQLAVWIEELFPSDTRIVTNRPMLLTCSIVSSMLLGGAYGPRVLAGIIRAIARHRQQSFVIGGRIHVELSLTWGMITEGEARIWLPDALSACLWGWLSPEDVAEILSPISHWKGMRPPSDAEIFRRVGRVVRSCCDRNSRAELGTLADLRRACWVIAHPNLMPVMARYADGEISCNAPARKELRRLFPKGEFIESAGLSNPALIQGGAERKMSTKESTAVQPAPESGKVLGGSPINLQQPATRSWVFTVQKAAGSAHPAEALGVFANGKGPAALLARFGISLLSSTLYSGEKVAQHDLARALKLLSESLAADMEAHDLAGIKMEDALDIYVRAINRHPTRLRREVIKWVLSLDLYIRACIKPRDPIPLSKLPWPPEGGNFEVGFVTHEEFREILSRIEQFWDARDSPRRRELIRLIVIIAFRLGLRADEIRKLRMRNLLLRGEPEIILWPWPGDRFKTRNARRRVPLRGLLTYQELAELVAWWRSRSNEKAAGRDRLFAIPDEKLQEVPGWLFDELNDFLHTHSEGSPTFSSIHMHIFRHACQCWQFTAMMMLEGGIAESPFPNLELTNQFLACSADLARAEFGHDRPTGKRAYFQAAFAGHASFDATTARSYIHMFPWLLASLLEASQTMTVGESLVNLASGQPESTRRDWRKRGVHNIAVQLLIHRYRSDLVFIPEAGQNPLGEIPAISSLEMLWNSLWRNAIEPASDVDPAMQSILDRAEVVAKMKFGSGAFRHPMQTRNGNSAERLDCPARPRRVGEIRRSGVWEQICRGEPDIIRDGLHIFVERVDEDGWVSFEKESEAEEAKRYVRFLCELGFNGDPQVVARSGSVDKWKERLGYQGSKLHWNYVPVRSKMSVSIRPSLEGAEKPTHAGFRFAVVMAYIRFGSRTA